MSYIVIITRSPVIMFLLTLLQSTHYSTLPVGLKLWDLFGHTGHSQWSVSVGNSYIASKAATTLSPTLIHMLLQLPNWTKSRTITMPTRILHFSHQIKRVLGSFEECNFFLYILAQGLSVLIILIDPTSFLCFPCQKNPTIPEGLLSKIIVTLVTQYNTTCTIIKCHLTVNEIEIWGKFCHLEGSNMMRVVQVSRSNTEDNQDASYVRVHGFFLGTLFILSS